MIIAKILPRNSLWFALFICSFLLFGCLSTGSPQTVKKQEPTQTNKPEINKKPSSPVKPVTPEPIASQSSTNVPGNPAPVQTPSHAEASAPAANTEMPKKDSSAPGSAPNPMVKQTSPAPPPAGPSSTPAPESKSAVLKEKPKTQADHDTSKWSDQELLDAALEYFQSANELWEQGDLDNAIEALDNAYAFILKVDKADDPDVSQQKEDLRITIAKLITEVYASRFTVANGNHKAIPLVLNKHVEKALAVLKGPDRDNFLAAYRLSGKYRPAIVKALEKAGLPTELSWLPLIESGFKIRAMSRARALGLWQFIASTGYKFGLKRDTWIDERMDPEKSTAAAIAYLQELHNIFGDWTTVLAAYNCGEYAVLRRIKNQRMNYLDNFWDLYEELPRETAFYVPKFMAVLHIINDPQAHGFSLPPLDAEIEIVEVNINKKMQLTDTAKPLGIDSNLLRDLNPELRHGITPDKPYMLKVPKGSAELLSAKLNEIPAYEPPVPPYFVYTVQRGDTISTISRRFRISLNALMEANDLRKRHYLRVGMHLRIPSGRYAPSSMAKTTRSFSSTALVRYTVKEGDSLWTIANRYHTTVDSIRSLNKLKERGLKMGQEILIAPNRGTSVPPSDAKAYIVQEGETLYAIAKKHQMTLNEFLSLNNLNTASTIYPGQVVKIKSN